ncbi:MAG TPA: alpha-hydroxy-acid oxidizing protein [Candidatus Thermoplasmatota archaeon]|nr:alpha-hydroxy-acid oxidizing protein [Candidatus Thermoplasmatota archaeon]
MDWTLSDVEAFARRTLTQAAYDYVAGGAGEERTLRDNVEAFRRQTLRPRFMVDVSKRDLSTPLLGQSYPCPSASPRRRSTASSTRTASAAWRARAPSAASSTR